MKRKSSPGKSAESFSRSSFPLPDSSAPLGRNSREAGTVTHATTLSRRVVTCAGKILRRDAIRFCIASRTRGFVSEVRVSQAICSPRVMACQSGAGVRSFFLAASAEPATSRPQTKSSPVMKRGLILICFINLRRHPRSRNNPIRPLRLQQCLRR